MWKNSELCLIFVCRYVYTVKCLETHKTQTASLTAPCSYQRLLLHHFLSPITFCLFALLLFCHFGGWFLFSPHTRLFFVAHRGMKSLFISWIRSVCHEAESERRELVEDAFAFAYTPMWLRRWNWVWDGSLLAHLMPNEEVFKSYNSNPVECNILIRVCRWDSIHLSLHVCKRGNCIACFAEFNNRSVSMQEVEK